jgi:hypothetical protein
MKVYHIILTNGDEIFAEVNLQDDHGLVVNNPLILQSDTLETGETSMYFSNYIPYSDSSECTFRWEHVMTFTKVTKTVAKFYELSLVFSEDTDIARIDNIKQSIQQMSDTLHTEEFGVDDDIAMTASERVYH